MRIGSIGVVLATAALTVAAYGATDHLQSPAAAASASTARAAAEPPALPAMQRRVDVEMKDNVFSPTTLDVKLGETVTFVFTNTGEATHDAFLGDEAAQEEHENEMRARKDPSQHHAGHEGGVTVAPGETGTMQQRFDEPGPFEIGCHELGHYAAGMTILINVKVI